MEDLKKFSWVKGVVLVVGGYGKQTVVAVRGIEVLTVKLKYSAKTEVFSCDELSMVEKSHEALMEKISHHAMKEEQRLIMIKQNPNIGSFAW